MSAGAGSPLSGSGGKEFEYVQEEPTRDEIERYARFLRLDPVEHSDLLWIAREGLTAPLPRGWRPCQTAQGELYYLNETTSKTSWSHPLDAHYRAKVEQEKAKKHAMAADASDAAKSAPPVPISEDLVPKNIMQDHPKVSLTQAKSRSDHGRVSQGTSPQRPRRDRSSRSSAASSAPVPAGSSPFSRRARGAPRLTPNEEVPASAAVRADLAALKQEKALLVAESASLRTVLASLQERKQKTLETLDESVAKVGELQNRLADERRTHEERLSELSRSIGERTDARAALQTELGQLEQKCSSLRSEVQRRLELNRRSISVNGSMKEEMVALKQRVQTLEAANVALVDATKALEAERDAEKEAKLSAMATAQIERKKAEDGAEKIVGLETLLSAVRNGRSEAENAAETGASAARAAEDAAQAAKAALEAEREEHRSCVASLEEAHSTALMESKEAMEEALSTAETEKAAAAKNIALLKQKLRRAANLLEGFRRKVEDQKGVILELTASESEKAADAAEKETELQQLRKLLTETQRRLSDSEAVQRELTADLKDRSARLEIVEAEKVAQRTQLSDAEATIIALRSTSASASREAAETAQKNGEKYTELLRRFDDLQEQFQAAKAGKDAALADATKARAEADLEIARVAEEAAEKAKAVEEAAAEASQAAEESDAEADVEPASESAVVEDVHSSPDPDPALSDPDSLVDDDEVLRIAPDEPQLSAIRVMLPRPYAEAIDDRSPLSGFQQHALSELDEEEKKLERAAEYVRREKSAILEQQQRLLAARGDWKADLRSTKRQSETYAVLAGVKKNLDANARQINENTKQVNRIRRYIRLRKEKIGILRGRVMRLSPTPTHEDNQRDSVGNKTIEDTFDELETLSLGGQDAERLVDENKRIVDTLNRIEKEICAINVNLSTDLSDSRDNHGVDGRRPSSDARPLPQKPHRHYHHHRPSDSLPQSSGRPYAPASASSEVPQGAIPVAPVARPHQLDPLSKKWDFYFDRWDREYASRVIDFRLRMAKWNEGRDIERQILDRHCDWLRRFQSDLKRPSKYRGGEGGARYRKAY